MTSRVKKYLTILFYNIKLDDLGSFRGCLIMMNGCLDTVECLKIDMSEVSLKLFSR